MKYTINDIFKSIQNDSNRAKTKMNTVKKFRNISTNLVKNSHIWLTTTLAISAPLPFYASC